MSKGLEALERLSTVASMYCDECATSEEDLDSGMFEKDYQAVKTIEKELKALEIIKKKKVDVWSLGICYSLKNYHYVISAKTYPDLKLTQQEFDLLKEILL